MQDLSKLTELVKSLPGTLQEAGATLVERMGEVIEGIGDKPIEWRPGTVKLVQGTSDRGKLPKGAGIGSLVLGEKILGTPFAVIVLRTWTSRQYWDPNPENAQMLCNSPDGQVGYQYGECKVCPYSKFDTENNKSQCNKTLSVLCLAADLSDVFVVNFSKTNYMNGMDWQGLMKKAGVAPYKRIYELSSVTSTKAKNVELLKAEPAKDNKVEGDLLAFVEELFRISGEDRKVSLVKFYEYAEMKKKNAGAQLAAPADIVLIGNDDGAEAAPVELATVSDEVTEVVEKPKKYKM